MAARPVVIVSNRGPVAFRRDADGALHGVRGAGGLVSGLAPVVAGTDALWIAAALTDADRDAAHDGVVETEGLRVATVAPEAEDLRLAYDVVSNETLWFVHHGMLDHVTIPTFDAAWFAAWDAYRRVNEAFATTVAELAPPGAIVLVQDYHLTLVAQALASRRPDLDCVHFTHTPFARPAELAVLPTAVRTEMLQGLAAHVACGFHSERWAGAARGAARAVGVDLRTFVAPLGPDPDDLATSAGTRACAEEHARLDALVGERRFLVRVDRIELSKNIVRGFLAFEHLLATTPEMRGEVVFGAFVYPSRQNVPAYRAYRATVERTVAEVNQRWGQPEWTPILYEPDDHYPRSVAALRRADAVLVNPIRDGLNLVAKEAALLNERDAVVLLSPGAGAFDELASHVETIDAYDVVAGAASLRRALTLSAGERAQRATGLRAAVRERSPSTWLAAQVAEVARQSAT